MSKVVKIDPRTLAPVSRNRIGDEFRASYEIKDPRYVTKLYRWDGKSWIHVEDRDSGYRDGYWFEDKP